MIDVPQKSQNQFSQLEGALDNSTELSTTTHDDRDRGRGRDRDRIEAKRARKVDLTSEAYGGV